MSDDAHHREPAAAGGDWACSAACGSPSCRATGAATRDVLVEVEEADATTVSYGGGLEVGRRLRPGDDGGPAEERLDVAPRGFFDISRRNLWGKNRSVTLFARVTLRPRDPAVDNTDPTDTGGYGLNDYRGFFSFREPRAFGTDRRRAGARPSSSRACARASTSIARA